MKKRCEWVGEEPLYLSYHDNEWGVPVHDERKQFELLTLEGAQAGLSWLIVLKKRENYRKAFDNFDPVKIAAYDERKIKELLSNEGIIRNRLKIESAIQNARAFLAVQEEYGSFDAYLWQLVGGRPKINAWKTMEDIPSKTPESDEMSQTLKKKGFKFVGSTICYSHMQAVGMVNDHTVDCFRYMELLK